MNNKWIRKAVIVGITMVVGIAVCMSVWFFLREHKASELQGQNRSSSPNNEVATDATPLTKKQPATQQAKSHLMSDLTEEQLAKPATQKMVELMDSPAFFSFLERSFTNREWNDFMESQGVPVIREYPGLFNKAVPNTKLADYEPVVRRKFAELFIAAEPVDLTDPKAAARQRSAVYLELGKELSQTDMATVAWFIETFGEDRDAAFRSDASNDSPAFVWMTDVQRNAASIVAAAEQAGASTPETQASAPSWDMSSVMDSPSVSSDATTEESPSIFPSVTDALEPSAIPKPETDATATPAPRLTDVPKVPTNLPTVEGLETVLKAQFSSERFERAMSTLEQYGPKEGLRRLRENDPEVASQIERHRNRSRSEDFDKSEEEVSR